MRCRRWLCQRPVGLALHAQGVVGDSQAGVNGSVVGVQLLSLLVVSQSKAQVPLLKEAIYKHNTQLLEKKTIY